MECTGNCVQLEEFTETTYEMAENAAALRSALTAAQARIEKLTAALGRFTLSCENIHHKRGEYHNSDEPCKALAAVEKAMGE